MIMFLFMFLLLTLNNHLFSGTLTIRIQTNQQCQLKSMPNYINSHKVIRFNQNTHIQKVKKASEYFDSICHKHCIMHMTIRSETERQNHLLMLNLVSLLVVCLRLLSHVVASVRNALQLPLSDIFIPVDVLLNHLLQANRLTRRKVTKRNSL